MASSSSSSPTPMASSSSSKNRFSNTDAPTTSKKSNRSSANERKNDDLEVIFVNPKSKLMSKLVGDMNKAAAESPSTSSEDSADSVIIDEDERSPSVILVDDDGNNMDQGKIASCIASSSSSSTASSSSNRPTSVFCAFHHNHQNSHVLIGGGKSNANNFSKCKIKRKSDNDQTPSLGKKQCQSYCGGGESSSGCMEDGNEYDEDEENQSIETCGVDTPPSPVSSTIAKYGIQNDIVSPEIAEWVTSFLKFNEMEKQQALTALIPNCSLNNIRHVHKTIEPYFRRDFISMLPKELSLHVLSYLEPSELLNAALVCNYWRTLTEDVILWREKCLEEGVCPDSLPAPPSGSPAGSACFNRCAWKSVYLRHSRVEMNWRRGTPRRELILRGHDDHVITCLQICGDKIVSGSDDNTLRVWSASSGCNLVTMSGHSGGVWSSQISDEGDLVISGSTDRTVKVWEMNTGACLRTLFGHTSTVRCMALRGDILVSGSRDATLRVWDIRTGQCHHVLTGHLAAVRCVQFDGRRAVSGAYDCHVKVWDVEKETCLHTLEGHSNRVYSLQFDSERNIVVSGSLDTSIRVWDIGGGQCLHTLTGHQSLTSGMQLRGNILVSGNADSTIKVWDISNGQCLHTLAGGNRHQSAVTSLQFLQNGLVVSSSDDGSVKLWDALTGLFLRDVVRLPSCGTGGCIWRLRATPTMLLCAVGSRNGTEETKLLVLDFNADYP